MGQQKYSIEIKRTGNKCSNGEDEHSIHIHFGNELVCEYERSSTGQLSRKLSEIQYMIDEIYKLTLKNNGGIIRWKEVNGQRCKCFCDKSEEPVKELSKRDWEKITNSFKIKVKKIFEDNSPCR